MNAKLKTLFSGIVAVSLAAIISFSCSSPSTSGSRPLPVPTLPEGASIDVNTATAAMVVNSMKFGWNLGNTLDANDDKANWSNQKAGVEIDWGHKGTATPALFTKLKESGIKTVRIPISWHNHVDADMNINSAWMDHVQEVVNMAYNEGLFVIINIHHDNYNGSDSLGSKAGFTLLDADKAQSKKFVIKIWSQIADRFKDYDGHLVFETLNEPRIIGGNHEWNCTNNSWTCDTCRSTFAIINELNQAALDTIRDSGSNNAKRVVMFPAYVAAPYAATKAKDAGIFQIPTDSATNRLALSVHMYTPYNFAMNPTGHSEFTASDKSELAQHFADLNTTFISKGIPVVIGEMGATNRDNFEDRKAWFAYYLDLCKQYNVAAVLWDNGNETNASDPAEAFGYMNRKANGGPAWFTDSKVSDLIAAAVEARGVSGNNDNNGGAGSDSNSKTIWTGSKDLKHWSGSDGITLNASDFTDATNSSYLKITISKGAECTAKDDQGNDCSNNYSTIQPITDWTDGNINFNTDSPAVVNTSKQLDISGAVPANGTATVTIKPDSTSWAAIKSKGLILYGHKVVITKIELL